MLTLQFFATNFHFASNLFIALVTFAVFWLYFDAWLSRKTAPGALKWIGFLLLSLSFLAHATVIEQAFLGQSPLGSAVDGITLVLRLLAYGLIVISLIIDPLQAVPKNEGLQLGKPSSPAILPLGTFKPGLGWLLPLGSFIVSLLYWRRATKGLENHLKPVAQAFLVITVAEVIALAAQLRSTINPIVADLVAAFGIIWWIEHILYLFFAIILGNWVWKYLTKRLQSQLFMIMTTVTMAIFLLTTVSFTYLLLGNIQRSALENLETASQVLRYAITAKQAESLANAETVAQNPATIAAVAARNHAALAAQYNDFLARKKQTSLIITNSDGMVLLRAEDPDRWGDSISSDALVRRALIGNSSSSLMPQDDGVLPQLYIISATPIRNNEGLVIGTATVGLTADDGFVDGIKQSTGLNSAIYTGNQRSATTFLAPDGKSRFNGIKEENPEVKRRVLEQGETHQGIFSVSNRSLLAIYTPLKDVNNNVVGMLLIGQPQIGILQSAGRSIELTFLMSILLLILSIFPAYLIARYLSKQLK